MTRDHLRSSAQRVWQDILEKYTLSSLEAEGTSADAHSVIRVADNVAVRTKVVGSQDVCINYKQRLQHQQKDMAMFIYTFPCRIFSPHEPGAETVSAIRF